LTQLYQDGKLIGTIPAHTAGSPLEDAFAAFGLEGTFQKISTWKGSLMTDAFSAYQLEGTFQTLSTWNATRKSSTTAPGNPSPSGASRPLPEPSPVLQVPRSEKLGLFDRVWSWLRNLRGRSAR
jgi:hypothetical protein